MKKPTKRKVFRFRGATEKSRPDCPRGHHQHCSNAYLCALPCARIRSGAVLKFQRSRYERTIIPSTPKAVLIQTFLRAFHGTSRGQRLKPCQEIEKARKRVIEVRDNQRKGSSSEPPRPKLNKFAKGGR